METCSPTDELITANVAGFTNFKGALSPLIHPILYLKPQAVYHSGLTYIGLSPS